MILVYGMRNWKVLGAGNVAGMVIAGAQGERKMGQGIFLEELSGGNLTFSSCWQPSRLSNVQLH